MKKFIGILMVIVFTFMFTNVIADECDCNYCKADRWVHKWARENGYEKCANNIYEGDTHYYCGVLIRSNFEKETGIEFSIPNWANSCCDKYNLYECTVEQKFDGIRQIYYCETETADAQFRDEKTGVIKVKAIFTIIDEE